MKISLRRLVLIVMLSLLPLASLSAATRIDKPSKPMTVREARKALIEALVHIHGRELEPVTEVRFNRRMVAYSGFDRIYSGNTLTGKQLYQGSITFTTLQDLTVQIKDVWSLVRSKGQQIAVGGRSFAYFDSERAARQFIDAVLTLKAAALAPDTEPADLAAFEIQAKDWLTLSPKPEMPDDARALKALAEDAFKRKDFTAALDAYSDALGNFPMWPEGHYNAALLAGETGDYELAARHMHRYLVLAPDAPDASAAKDKFLLWQLKAKQ